MNFILLLVASVISSNVFAQDVCPQRIKLFTGKAEASRAASIEATLRRELPNCQIDVVNTIDLAIIKSKLLETDLAYLAELNNASNSFSAEFGLAIKEYLGRGGFAVKVGGYGSDGGRGFAAVLNLGMTTSSIDRPGTTFQIEVADHPLFEGITSLHSLEYLREYNFPSHFVPLVTASSKKYVALGKYGEGQLLVIGYSYFKQQSGTSAWDRLLGNAARMGSVCRHKVDLPSIEKTTVGSKITLDAEITSSCEVVGIFHVHSWVEGPDRNVLALWPEPMFLEIDPETTVELPLHIDTSSFAKGRYILGLALTDTITGKRIANSSSTFEVE